MRRRVRPPGRLRQRWHRRPPPPVVTWSVPPELARLQGVSAVYRIVNTADGGSDYIGQSRDVARRWCTHLAGMVGGYPSAAAFTNDALVAAVNQYGLAAFRFELLEECQPHDLLRLEAFYIQTYRPVYNRVRPAVQNKAV